MLVIAAKGIKVPREADPRSYIVDDAPEEVVMTNYYIRRMADGDLLEPTEAQVAAAAKKATLEQLSDADGADKKTGDAAAPSGPTAGRSARSTK